MAGSRTDGPRRRRATRPSERDLAVVVAAAVPAAAIEAAIRSAAGEHLVGLRLFDIYRGAPLAADEKSVNWRLVFQAPDRTLTDAEVDGGGRRGHDGARSARRPDQDLSPVAGADSPLLP